MQSCLCRYADALALAHDAEHLTKFEELLEAAVDLDAIPDEYLICATYDPRLQVCSLSLMALLHRRCLLRHLWLRRPAGETCPCPDHSGPQEPEE